MTCAAPSSTTCEERVGKASRVREKRYVGPEEVVEPGLLHDPSAALEAEAAATDGAVDADGGTIDEAVGEVEFLRPPVAEGADGGAGRRGTRC